MNSKKRVKLIFSAALLLLMLILAGTVVYAAYTLPSLGDHGTYTPLVVDKVWDDAGHESERPDHVDVNIAVQQGSGGKQYADNFVLSEGSEWIWSTSGSLLANPVRVLETPIEKYVTFYSNPKPTPDGNAYQVTITNKYIEEKFTVTYHDTLTADKLQDGEEPFKDEVHDNVNYNAKTPVYNGGVMPVHKGYIFMGWSKNSKYASEPFTVNTYVTENQDYYAVYKKVYTIIYNDGVPDEEVFKDQIYPVEVRVTPNMESVYTPYFRDENGSQITPAREGYKFIKWSPVVAPYVTEDKTYEAQWEPTDERFTVTYRDTMPKADMPLAEGETPFADEVHTDIPYNAKTPTYNLGNPPKHEGYVFMGWYPEDNQYGSVNPYVTKNIVYLAKWVKAYTVTYNDGVDDEEIFPDQVYPGCGYGTYTPAFVWKTNTRDTGEGSEPVRPGYKFKGWEPAVETWVYHDAVYKATWEKVEEPSTPGVPVNPTTYTVTYTDGVDGEVVFIDQITEGLLYGSVTPAFAGTPTREGYTFEGWTPAVASQVTGNAVYTATWKPVPPKEEPKDDPKDPDEPKKKPTDPEKPTKLPDPNDPDSPDEITIWDGDVPLSYVKTWDPEKDEYIYVLEEDVPLSGLDTPGTGDESQLPLWVSLVLISLCGLAAMFAGWRKRIEK
ncbi:MAG: hypothetical protein HFE73_08265 [Firmicutes bacterium]|nr:hypothetical protein [Bacillota bacterium]